MKPTSTDKRGHHFSQLWFKIPGCLSALTVVPLLAWQKYRVNVHTHQVPRQPATLKNQNWQSCQQTEFILTSPKLDQPLRPNSVATTDHCICSSRRRIPNMQLSPRTGKQLMKYMGKVGFGSLEQANNSSDKENAINGCLLGCVLHSFLCSGTRMPNLKLWLKMSQCWRPHPRPFFLTSWHSYNLLGSCIGLARPGLR